MPEDNKMKVCAADVVLTGLSGRLPESDSIDEFAEKLFAGVDFITADDRRWTQGLYGLPKSTGKIKDLTQFDATFFGVHSKQASYMDPQLRLLLEVVYEAMIDAGVSPPEMRGSRTGVFVGTSASDTEDMWNWDVEKINGYSLLGCCRSMFANRISYTFDLKGPSYAIDTACSSSMYALAQAVNAIRMGRCDSAIVAGTNLCLKPSLSLNFLRLGMLSMEGRCASFDASGNGYVRSEAVVALFLQRRDVARRVYCTVQGSCMNTDGYKEQGITFPSSDSQLELSRETFAKAGVKPKDLSYFEAHGTGTQVGDPEEVNAVADFFCEGRTTPLLMGSVKSNMGHSEPASGLCSIAKVVLAMERGELPPNLHYKTPNPSIPALNDGRIQVVDRVTPWDGGLVAISSFGFGGANAHIILECERGPLPQDDVTYTLPRLICVSGRTEEGVRSLLSTAVDAPRRSGLHALLDAAHRHHIPGHDRRGYLLLHNPSQPLIEVQECDSEPRPVWFVFSGMGSQYSGMAKELMTLKTFANSIDRCAAALKPYNIDLKMLLTDAPDSAFDKVLNCFVTITAVQVALIDLLRELKIKPDGIIGHSMGEIGCAYADDGLSAEQAVLCAYWRGQCVVDAKLGPGAMASVGLSWEEAVQQCPPDIMIACHNSADNVTITGPVPSIKSFAEKLSAKGTFNRIVKCGGYAFHSKYIADAGPLLQQKLEKLIDQPKRRSANWISSSLPKDQWNSDRAKLCDASYHVNNLLSPVLFSTALQELPKRALLIEIAPHALLKPLLRRALPNAKVVGLLQRGAENQLVQLLSSIGEIYCGGAQPVISKLYPPVTWPVCRGTPGLASKVKWDHSIQWLVANYGKDQQKSGDSRVKINLSESDDAYIAGHNIDGRILFPASGYLRLVWRTMAKMFNKSPTDTAVVLENIQFKRETIMSKDSPTEFLVSILPGSGEFSVCEGTRVAVTGTIRIVENSKDEKLAEVLPAETGPKDALQLPLATTDVYRELQLRGYHYDGLFKGIMAVDSCRNQGELAWCGNWVSFIDTMMQFSIIGIDTRDLYVPTRLRRLLIDPTVQPALGSNVSVCYDKDSDVIVAGGVEMRGLKTTLALRRPCTQVTKLERFSFAPLNCNISTQTKIDALTVCMQILMENAGVEYLKIMEEALGKSTEILLTPVILQILQEEPYIKIDASVKVGIDFECNILKKLGVKLTTDILYNTYNCVLAKDILKGNDEETLVSLVGALQEKGMLLLEESSSVIEKISVKDMLHKTGLRLVAKQPTPTVTYLLFRKHVLLPPPSLVMEIPDDNNYEWVLNLRHAMESVEGKDTRLYLWSKSIFSGILGLATCLRREPGGKALRVYYLPGFKNAFSLTSTQFKEQIQMDLCCNVLKNNTWGTMRHLSIPDVREVELPVSQAYVNTVTRGELASLRWIASPLHSTDNTELPKSTDLCKVYYAPLNFQDIMIATATLPPDALPNNLAGEQSSLGLEFSGRNSDGKRVMGMVKSRGLSTSVFVDKDFLWEVPEKWTLEQAATVPVAYTTAYYALCVRGQMCHGDSVLIHAGTSCVGQAAITIALHMGCEVFTTVGTPEKRSFLFERFPQLSKDNIGNSRNTSFEQLVRWRTRGRGVDLVLNSLTADKLAASVRCLAIGGRFLELGKLDLAQNKKLGTSVFLKNTAFHGICLNTLFTAASDNPNKIAVIRYVSDGIASGVVQPLPVILYDSHQFKQAFQLMTTGKHIGKVLLRIRSDDSKPVVPAVSQIYMHPDKSYVLIGGLSGFGLELASWMVTRGATRLVLSSRNGVRTGCQAWRISVWQRAGVRVLVSTTDWSSGDGARSLLQQASQLGPVGGVFNLAAVFRDALLKNLTPEDFRTVTRPKLDGTKELDEATRALCPYLDYFVTFSSISSSRGKSGQSNYGFANSAMERICEERQVDGLPGLAIQWGAIGDVDLEAEHMDKDDGEVRGILPQKICSCMSALETFLSNPYAVVVSMVVANKTRDDQLNHKADVNSFMADILGIKDTSQYTGTVSLGELGIDSFKVAEIKLILERNFDVLLEVQDIQKMTLEELRAFYEEDSKERVK